MRSISLKSLTIIFLISQAGILFFLFQLPNPLDALWLQLTYSPEQFKAIVFGWSSEHLNFYLNHYYLDFAPRVQREIIKNPRTSTATH